MAKTVRVSIDLMHIRQRMKREQFLLITHDEEDFDRVATDIKAAMFPEGWDQRTYTKETTIESTNTSATEINENIDNE